MNDAVFGKRQPCNMLPIIYLTIELKLFVDFSLDFSHFKNCSCLCLLICGTGF
jgi:hypothetical protein